MHRKTLDELTEKKEALLKATDVIRKHAKRRADAKETAKKKLADVKVAAKQQLAGAKAAAKQKYTRAAHRGAHEADADSDRDQGRRPRGSSRRAGWPARR
eukprot:7388535-Prymnesium_polylepis.1